MADHENGQASNQTKENEQDEKHARNHNSQRPRVVLPLDPIWSVEASDLWELPVQFLDRIPVASCLIPGPLEGCQA